MLRLEAAAKAKEEALLRRRHTVLRRELPRPVVVNTSMEEVDEEGEGQEDVDEEVTDLLRREIISMLKYDAFHHPLTAEQGLIYLADERNNTHLRLTVLLVFF